MNTEEEDLKINYTHIRYASTKLSPPRENNVSPLITFKKNPQLSKLTHHAYHFGMSGSFIRVSLPVRVRYLVKA